MKLEEFVETEEERELFEMSNLRKSTTGLPVNIYVSSGGSVNNRHGPRLKAMFSNADKFNHSQTISVMLKKDVTKDDVIGYDKINPIILKALRTYINLNYEVLMKHWNDEIDSVELIQQLKKIPN